MICHFCKRDIPGVGKIHRRDNCPFCENDLHICFNCDFFDEKLYNKCKESNAEFVGEKDKANFCEYFHASKQKGSFIKKSQNARKNLEELFKKPGS